MPITVVMEKRAVASRWVTHEWRAAAAELATLQGKSAETLGGSEFQRHEGFEITLFRDEAEGYYLNVTTGASIQRAASL